MSRIAHNTHRAQALGGLEVTRRPQDPRPTIFDPLCHRIIRSAAVCLGHSGGQRSRALNWTSEVHQMEGRLQDRPGRWGHAISSRPPMVLLGALVV